jgi:hypothetical protein
MAGSGSHNLKNKICLSGCCSLSHCLYTDLVYMPNLCPIYARSDMTLTNTVLFTYCWKCSRTFWLASISIFIILCSYLFFMKNLLFLLKNWLQWLGQNIFNVLALVTVDKIQRCWQFMDICFLVQPNPSSPLTSAALVKRMQLICA